MNDEVQLPTADQIVQKYMELRDYVRLSTEAFNAQMKPYVEAMATLEGAAAMLMKKTGVKNLSTEFGTAYQQAGKSVTVEDHEKFLTFVFSQPENKKFLTRHVSKEQVETFMEGVGNGHPPPGIKVAPYVNTNFRRL